MVATTLVKYIQLVSLDSETNKRTNNFPLLHTDIARMDNDDNYSRTVTTIFKNHFTFN